MNSQWQWMDDRFGPMGWFSDADKKQLENTEEFASGHWRRLATSEVASMNAYVGRLAYEQA
jgi:hypothetical protein